MLVIACVASALVAASFREPSSLVRSDPELALLLRGMALIKGAMVFATIAALFWRFGHPVLVRFAVTYTCSVGLLTAASMLLWQLSFIPLAAVAFHVAAFIIVVASWRDDGLKFKRLQRASESFHPAGPEGHGARLGCVLSLPVTGQPGSL